MKAGDKIEVRNMGSDAWVNARVVQINKDGTLRARVDQDGHEWHGKVLTFDDAHFRVPAPPTTKK